MQGEAARMFIDAAEAAELDYYQFDTDLGTHLYHNGKNGILKYIDDKELVLNIRDSYYGGNRDIYPDRLQVIAATIEDIHEARINGPADKIKVFLESLGADITDVDEKMMVNINNINVNIIPQTGDYNRFSPLTQKQYDELTPEQKEKYDEELAAYNEAKAKYIGQHAAARIDLG